MKHKHASVLRRVHAPKDELPQERSYCRKADSAESSSPTITDVIVKAPGVDKLWRLTGIELVEKVLPETDPISYYGLKIYYRALKVGP